MKENERLGQRGAGFLQVQAEGLFLGHKVFNSLSYGDIHRPSRIHRYLEVM